MNHIPRYFATKAAAKKRRGKIKISFFSAGTKIKDKAPRPRIEMPIQNKTETIIVFSIKVKTIRCQEMDSNH